MLQPKLSISFSYEEWGYRDASIATCVCVIVCVYVCGGGGGGVSKLKHDCAHVLVQYLPLFVH